MILISLLRHISARVLCLQSLSAILLEIISEKYIQREKISTLKLRAVRFRCASRSVPSVSNSLFFGNFFPPVSRQLLNG